MQLSLNRRTDAELCLMRLCDDSLCGDLTALAARIARLERGGVAAAQPAPVAPVPQRPIAPKRQSAPAPIPEPVSEEEVPFTGWSEVLENLRGSCMPLYGVLIGSEAVLRGDRLLICTENEMFRGLVAQDNNKQKLLTAVRAVTGRAYRIGLKKSVPPAAEVSDPLTAFLRESRERGVPVIEE
jgi:DNA polymerase-3 subunit gamma/tau